MKEGRYWGHVHLDSAIDRLSHDIKSEVVCLDIHQTIKKGIVDIINRMSDNLKTEIAEITTGREGN